MSTSPKTDKTINSENASAPFKKKTMSEAQLEKLAKARELANIKRSEIAEIKRREKAVKEQLMQERLAKVEAVEQQLSSCKKKAVPAPKKKMPEPEPVEEYEDDNDENEEPEEDPPVQPSMGGKPNALRQQYSRLLSKYKETRSKLNELALSHNRAAAHVPASMAANMMMPPQMQQYGMMPQMQPPMQQMPQQAPQQDTQRLQALMRSVFPMG